MLNGIPLDGPVDSVDFLPWLFSVGDVIGLFPIGYADRLRSGRLICGRKMHCSIHIVCGIPTFRFVRNMFFSRIMLKLVNVFVFKKSPYNHLSLILDRKGNSGEFTTLIEIVNTSLNMREF